MVGCLTLAQVAYEEAGGKGEGAGPPTATSTRGFGGEHSTSECKVTKKVACAAAVAVAVGTVMMVAKCVSKRK